MTSKTYIYDDKKWNSILEDIEKEENYAKLTDWEKRFISTCLVMNDKRIGLTSKQRPILERIYNEIGER